jgi:hypothetical protein
MSTTTLGSRVGSSSGDNTHSSKAGGRNPRVGSGKMSNSMVLNAGLNSEEPSAVFELSLKPKPQKLKPLVKNTKNLAQSLLDDDKRNKQTDYESMASSAQLDLEIKNYMDPN